jgi:hypothetical protein
MICVLILFVSLLYIVKTVCVYGQWWADMRVRHLSSLLAGPVSASLPLLWTGLCCHIVAEPAENLRSQQNPCCSLPVMTSKRSEVRCKWWRKSRHDSASECLPRLPANSVAWESTDIQTVHVLLRVWGSRQEHRSFLHPYRPHDPVQNAGFMLTCRCFPHVMISELSEARVSVCSTSPGNYGRLFVNMNPMPQ